MNLQQLIQDYVKNNKVMQIATENNGQPWVCTVYYAEDEHLNFYWISTAVRRHSKELRSNPKVAGSIVVKHEYGKPIVGLQIEGIATEITEPEVIAKGMRHYVDKFGLGEDFYNDFLAGKNRHNLYKLKPQRFMLFDKVNFPDTDDTQEWKLT